MALPSQAAVKALLAVAAMTYPFGIYWGLTHGTPRTVGLLGLSALVPWIGVRLWRRSGEHLWAALRVPAVVITLLALSAIFDDSRFVLALPVLINVSLLIVFGASLRTVPTVERFARLVEPELSPAKVRHCREATVAWCLFFVTNGSIALVLALFGPPSVWAVYNGGIAYALMGLMFAGEFLVRRYRFRDYGVGPHDRLIARLFPPPEVHP